MDRLTYILAATLFLAASCSKVNNPDTQYAGDLFVSVMDTEVLTKSILIDSTKTDFVSGDKIVVFDETGKEGRYKFRTKIAGKFVFQKESSTAGFDSSKVVSAFYPADYFNSYDKTGNVFTATFPQAQPYTANSFSNKSVPMAWFGAAGDNIIFFNCFGVVRFGFMYADAPSVALKLDTIALSSESSNLYGKFSFTKNGSSIDVKHISEGGNKIYLTGCEAGGALSTDTTYYYIAVPGITNASETMSIKVTPTSDVPFAGKFTATNGTSGNRVVKNVILRMAPFVLRPVPKGSGTSYTVDQWIQVDTIKVGQITVAKSEVTVSKNGSPTDVQINGVTDFSKISIAKTAGVSYFDADTVRVTGTPTKYYVRITGVAAGNGELYINDKVTNSGSYIYVTVQ